MIKQITRYAEKAVLLQHQPGILDGMEGVGRRAVHLCDSGHRSQQLIFGFILVESKFKLGLNAVLNDADLEHRQPSAQ